MVDIPTNNLNKKVMTTRNNDNQSSNRWTRVRKAYQSGELNKQKTTFQSDRKPSRRNALADISTVSTTADVSSQKHQYHQLAERVRELQNEIAPDLLLYQITPTYSPFSSITTSSNGSGGNIPTYPHRQSISMSSGTSNPSVPTQRFGLSSRIVERAHQIPERFWIDWQQKQMQDRIEELEYIKSNIGCNPGSSSLANDIDENGEDCTTIDPRIMNDEVRRKSVLFLHQAQRLANERRASLARATTLDESILKNIKEPSYLSDNDDHNSFNFDQRSEENANTANLNDLDEIPLEPIIPVQQSHPTLDRSRLTISLPFTYTNTREHVVFPSNYRLMSTAPLLEKVIEVSDDAIQSTEDVAQINTELNLTLLKREDSKKINPLFYTKAIVNRNIEFHKFRPISSRNNLNSLKIDITIHIPISKRKEINDSRSSSPTLSFKSARSRLSSNDDGEDLDDVDIQSTLVVLPSFSSRSQYTSPHITSSITQCYNHITNNNYPSLKQFSSYKCSSFSQNLPMNNVYESEQKSKSSSCTCYSITSSEEDDSLSFSRALFTRHHRQRKRKRTGNASCLSLISTSSLQNNFTFLRDSFYQENVNNNNNNNNNKSTLKTAYKNSINSSRRTWQWKHNAGGFQPDLPVNDNNDDITRSSSSSAAAAMADCLIQRQCRKQTRLKRKAESEKRKEKKKTRKKERNKKSPLSTTEAEATEASLFQLSAADPPTTDTAAIFHPYEQLRWADRSTAKEQTCFAIQTLSEHQKQQSKLHLTMADGHGNNTPNSIPKRKEHVRVFVRRRQRTTKQRKRTFHHSSSSSSNSYETIPSPSNYTNIEKFVSLIQQQIKNKKEKSRKNNNMIVVNYKPVFINSRQQKPSKTPKASPKLLPKPKLITTDDDCSSATHYSRRRSLTTTSSDDSPLPSTTNHSHNQQSVSLDVPDVEDPLMFIEMMYQQLFTEDGQLRSGAEPTALANCVRQIVTNSRRNSISSPITNGSTTSSHLKHVNVNTNHQQQKFPSSSYHHLTQLSSSPRIIPNEHYNSFSEEEEPNTLVQINSQRQTIKTNTDISARCSKRLEIDNPDNHLQIHAFLNSYEQKIIPTNRTTTISNGFRFSLDDTDNEDFDTFSDLNSIRFNNKTIGTSPSVDEDLTHTDSRLLSSSGYQSLDPPSKFLKQQKPILSKSHSENDLFDLLYKNNIQTRCIHYCPNCINSPNVIVIPPITPSLNLIKRIQQPIGEMFMKYLNFILISKNVLLLPLFIFLLRQRSTPIGN